MWKRKVINVIKVPISCKFYWFHTLYLQIRQQIFEAENIQQSFVDLHNLQSIQYYNGAESAELGQIREKVYDTIWPRLGEN